MTLAARLVGIVLLVGPAFGETLDPAATSLTIEVGGRYTFDQAATLGGFDALRRAA